MLNKDILSPACGAGITLILLGAELIAVIATDGAAHVCLG